jgi:hypothetical protein
MAEMTVREMARLGGLARKGKISFRPRFDSSEWLALGPLLPV